MFIYSVIWECCWISFVRMLNVGWRSGLRCFVRFFIFLCTVVLQSYLEFSVIVDWILIPSLVFGIRLTSSLSAALIRAQLAQIHVSVMYIRNSVRCGSGLLISHCCILEHRSAFYIWLDLLDGWYVFVLHDVNLRNWVGCDYRSCHGNRIDCAVGAVSCTVHPFLWMKLIFSLLGET